MVNQLGCTLLAQKCRIDLVLREQAEHQAATMGKPALQFCGAKDTPLPAFGHTPRSLAGTWSMIRKNPEHDPEKCVAVFRENHAHSRYAKS
jgi:hypothetical protein